MDGFTTWPLRDIIIICGIAGNLGGLIYLVRNHMHDVKKKLDSIDSRLDEHGERLARIEGKLEG